MVDLVNIGLSVDSREVVHGTKALKGLGDQSDKTGKATDAMLSTIKRYASIAAVAATVMKVVDAHREFQKSMSELSAITGATGNDLKFYREQALQLGSTTTFAASEVATAFKLVASAKPDLLESKEALAAVTREVLTLAEASGMQLPDAANALGGALNQFGAGAEEAGRFINVLAAGAKFGSSEINDTAEAMKNVGAVASSIGLSFEQTNAAIQALASVSIKGAEAGTGLRGVLLKLSTQARDEFNPEIVGLEQALKNLSAANLTTTEMSKIFGQESITAATALIKQADAVGQLTEKLTGTTTAMEQARINVDNLDGDIKAMNSSWEAAALMLGNALDPALRMVTKSAAWLGKVMQTLAVSLEDTIDLFGSYMAVAASVAALDFDTAKAVIAAREARKAETEQRISDIWKEKSAEEISNEAKKAAADAEIARIDEIAIAREAAAIKAAEIRESARMDSELDAAIFEEEELARITEQNEKKLAVERDYYDRLYNMQAGSQQAMYTFTDSLRQGDLKGALQYGALALSNAAKQNKGMFEVQKAFALANAAVTLPSAVLKSFNNGGGYPWGLIPAGLMLANGLSQINAIKSSTFGGGVSAPSVSGGGGISPSAPVESGLPPGSTATPEGTEQPQRRQIDVNIQGDGPNSEGMRKLAQDLAETIRDMGGNVELNIT